MMLNTYLEAIQNHPKVLYHAASLLTKTLKPRKSDIGTVPKKTQNKWNYDTSAWEKKAIFAATKINQAIPFGLERENMLWVNRYTEEEVMALKKGCYLSVNKSTNILQVNYYNHTPTKPVYLYTVDPKDFKFIIVPGGAAVEQWYSMKTITPLKTQKLYPNQVRESWIKIGKADWERKKEKYRIKGYFKKG